MKRILGVIVLLVVLNISYSQSFKRKSGSNEEFGVSLGASNYLGDLAFKGKYPLLNETNPRAFRPSIGIFYRNNFTKFTSFKAGLIYGGLFGDDAHTNKKSQSSEARRNRNLHFKSVVFDASLILEINFLPYRIGNSRFLITPYIGGGVAGFYFNPKAKLNGRWVALQPLGTEGQGIVEGKKKYSLYQFALPLNLGLKANITSRIALNLEFQYRHSFTDYIDDVSSDHYVESEIFYQNYIESIAADADALAYRAIDESLSPRNAEIRGESKYKDNYYFIVINIAFKLGKNRSTCGTYR